MSWSIPPSCVPASCLSRDATGQLDPGLFFGTAGMANEGRRIRTFPYTTHSNSLFAFCENPAEGLIRVPARHRVLETHLEEQVMPRKRQVSPNPP